MARTIETARKPLLRKSASNKVTKATSGKRGWPKGKPRTAGGSGSVKSVSVGKSVVKKFASESKVGKGKKKKRGWPKGKARKVADAEKVEVDEGTGVEAMEVEEEKADVSNVTKGKKKKRGWPKGKARKMQGDDTVASLVEEG